MKTNETYSKVIMIVSNKKGSFNVNKGARILGPYSTRKEFEKDFTIWDINWEDECAILVQGKEHPFMLMSNEDMTDQISVDSFLN